MARLVVLLSGAIASGKTNLSDRLWSDFGFEILKTRERIQALVPGVSAEREALQAAGEKLDLETDGRWVATELAAFVSARPRDALIAVDAVRIPAQIDHVRSGFGPRVKHIHLTAPEEELTERYENRAEHGVKELPTYADARRNTTERQVSELERSADIVIDTSRCLIDDILVRVACHLGLYGRGYDRVVDVIVGGQYGSEGKGQVAAYLAQEYDLLIRVGGPNAGHKVFEEPKPYTFKCLPSGSRCSTADIVIGAGAVISVETLLKEVNECEITPDRLTIDPQVMIISKEDIEAEAALQRNVSSTGQGVGAATARRIMERGEESTKLARDIDVLRPFIRPAYEVIDAACREKRKVLLEGTQGTGLSLYHGYYPHVTSRDTTVAGCLAEAGVSPSRVRRIVMVCRTYPIRVQDPDDPGKTSGRMSQPLTLEDISGRSGVPLEELRNTEVTSTTGRKRRIAEFDWALLKKAAILNAPTDIALTFTDYLDRRNQDARRLEQLTPETVRFIQEVERVAEAPVSLISTRFHYRSIIDRRSW